MPKKVKFHQIGHKKQEISHENQSEKEESVPKKTKNPLNKSQKAVKFSWKTERKGKSVPKKVKIHQIGHKITGISLYNGEHMRKVYPK